MISITFWLFSTHQLPGKEGNEGHRKEFWAFVGKRTKGKEKAIGFLRSDKGVSVSSARGKLQVCKCIFRVWVG